MGLQMAAAAAAGVSSSSSAPAATSQFTMPSRCCCSQLSGRRRRRRRRSSHSSISTLRTLLLALALGGIPLLHTLLPAAVLAQPQPQPPPPLRLQFSNNFSSPTSSSPDSTTSALLCLGACELTPTHATLPTAPSPGAIGIARLLYRTPVRFTSPASRTCASFRTSFIFSIASVAATVTGDDSDDSGANSNPTAPIADGLAFVITPRAGIPPRSGGGALGLFEPLPSDAGSGRPVPGTPPGTLAVEIDTFAGASNAWDPGYAPHVGLDLDSLRSVAVSPPVPEVAAGSTVGVWVRYDAAAGDGGGEGRLTVRVHATEGGAAVPEEARARTVVEYAGLDLAAAVPGESFVGFSATQGMYAQTNTLWFWDFELSFTQDDEEGGGGGQGEEEGPLAATAAGAGDNGRIVAAAAADDTRRRRSVALAVATPVAALGLCLMLVWTRRRWRKSSSGSSSISSSRPLVPLSSVPALEMADRPQRSPSPASGDGDHGCGGVPGDQVLVVGPRRACFEEASPVQVKQPAPLVTDRRTDGPKF